METWATIRVKLSTTAERVPACETRSQTIPFQKRVLQGDPRLEYLGVLIALKLSHSTKRRVRLRQVHVPVPEPILRIGSPTKSPNGPSEVMGQFLKKNFRETFIEYLYSARFHYSKGR